MAWSGVSAGRTGQGCVWRAQASAEPVLGAPAPAGLAAFRAGRWGSPNTDQHRNPPRPVPLNPGSEAGPRQGTCIPKTSPHPCRRWVCSGRGKQVFFLRNVSPPPGLATASSLHLAPLCSFRLCPVSRPSPTDTVPRTGASLPFPAPSGLLGASCVCCGCWCPTVPAVRGRLGSCQ